MNFEYSVQSSTRKRLSFADAKRRLTVIAQWNIFGLGGAPGKSCASPFRRDATPSFWVSPDGLRWRDLGTGDGGDNVEFFVKLSGLSRKGALRKFVEVAGRPGAVLAAAQAPPAKDDAFRNLPPFIPPFMAGTPPDIVALARLRGLSVEGVQLASDRGLLRFGEWHGRRAWLLLDAMRWNAQARRTDGELWWSDGPKALTLPTARASWPIGTLEAGRCPFIALVEGGPDLLAACHFIKQVGRQGDVAPVAILGAGHTIWENALSLFSGKRVRIFPHADAEGAGAATRWTRQLEKAGATVDCFKFGGLFKHDGAKVKDLNDLAVACSGGGDVQNVVSSIFP